MSPKKARAKSTKAAQRLQLIASNEKQPRVALKRGMRLEVVEVSLVDASLKRFRKPAARLCGGTSTCLALVFTDRGDPAP